MDHRRKRIITEIARKSGFMDRERLHTMSTPDLEKYLIKLEHGKDKSKLTKIHKNKKDLSNVLLGKRKDWHKNIKNTSSIKIY